MPGVLCTPHLGASTEEAQTQVAVEGCQLLIDYLTTGAIRCAVNMSTIDPAKLDAVRDYLNLGYRLGLMLAQMADKPAKACKLTYRGDVAGKETKLITSAFAAGLLEHAMDNQANIVNADVLLKERGIELLEQTRTDMGAFSSVIVAELTTEDQTLQGRRHGLRPRHGRGSCSWATSGSNRTSTASCSCSSTKTCRASSARSAPCSASTA